VQHLLLLLLRFTAAVLAYALAVYVSTGCWVAQ
jgi:hypothetical protein